MTLEHGHIYIKNLIAGVMTFISWIGAISVQDTITFVLASILTILSIYFVILGIRNRRIEHEIKQETLQDVKES